MRNRLNRIKKIFFVPVVLLLSMNGCIEPFDVEVIDFESALVVEATITNEMKSQRIFLTRTFEFDAEGPSPERNANVRVLAGSGNTFAFQEVEPGIYESEQAFAAQQGASYQLLVTTGDGRSYSSVPTALSQATQIDDLRAERITNDDGQDGVAILVDSFDPSGNSVNYRYTYEESYKIIAPFWNPEDLAVLEGPGIPPCQVEVVPREQPEEVCFATDVSNEIILTDTNDLEEDRVDNFMVRFINSENFIISHRYSILVKQFVQSNAAYNFYETLNEFSGSESLFSETQPGFLEGNVRSDENENEKVLGFFDVSAVAQQRIFFNYDDLYPGEDLPPYINPCRVVAPPIATPGGCVLSVQVELNLVRYVNENTAPQQGEGPFLVVPRVCGDCTEIGSTEPPEFWIE